MTEVKLTRTGGNRYTLRVKGHAGYAPAGQDIVCAGVSTLNWTALQCLAALDALEDVRQGEGSLYLAGSGPAAQRLMPVFLAGYRQLEAEYPGFVQVRAAARRGPAFAPPDEDTF